jgi:hypothetical protein
MTNLRAALDKYLSMRKGLGYKYAHQTRRLADSQCSPLTSATPACAILTGISRPAPS